MSAPPEAGLESRVRELGPWFHDLDLGGVRTAPDHPLGNFLHELWDVVRPAFPDDLSGRTVLDIGCNAGFYSLQLARRGARVTGIEAEPRYLEQARFAAETLGLDVEYVHLDVYDVDRLGRSFDYVLFLGVFYHLRHPLYALEKVASVVRERLVFQSMLRGPDTIFETAEDYPIGERDVFEAEGFPAMYFIEKRYAEDETNWWVPNRAAMEAMLRSCGLRIERQIGVEVYYCSPTSGREWRDGAA
jgi:tRNA (mo5U34)-methyltransferase